MRLILFFISFLIATPVPAKDLLHRNKELSFFIGTWNCSGKYESQEGSKKSSKPFKKEVVTFRPILNGSWIEGDYISENGKVNRCLYGKDGTNYRLQCFGEYEGLIVSRSPGWTQNKLLFKGKSYYHQYESSEIKDFTKISQNEYRVISKIDNEKANYHTLFEAKCIRQ